VLHTSIEPRLPKPGLNGIMRSTIAACAILVLLIGTADAEQCPPGALGVSRTIVVDLNEHSRVGSMQYPETLPLNDHEVVLTFDDGPLPRYTSRVLETLASECVQATFFMVGQMARAYPWMVRRVYDEGHTIANHTQNHPIRKMSVTQAAREIEEGFASLREAIGDPQAVSPFFRIPGLLRQKSVEQYLAALGARISWRTTGPASTVARLRNVPSAVSRRAARASCCCTTFTPAPSSRCPKFSTSSKAAATRSFMWFRQPRTGRKPRLPRSNGLPAPRPSSIRVHRKCAHCAKEYLAAMGRSPSRNESSIPRVVRCRRYHKPSSVALERE
jgi:Polysaccharide deacetylase